MIKKSLLVVLSLLFISCNSDLELKNENTEVLEESKTIDSIIYEEELINELEPKTLNLKDQKCGNYFISQSLPLDCLVLQQMKEKKWNYLRNRSFLSYQDL